MPHTREQSPYASGAYSSDASSPLVQASFVPLTSSLIQPQSVRVLNETDASVDSALTTRLNQQDACISALETQMAAMKASLDALMMHQHSMSHHICEQEESIQEMRSVSADRFDRVSLATAEVICYADGMRDRMNEISRRVEDIEHAFYELGEDVISEVTDNRQEPMEAQAQSPAKDKRESSSSSSLSEAAMSPKAALALNELEFDSRHQSESESERDSERDSFMRIMTEVFCSLATPDAATDSESSNGPELRLEKQEAASTSPPEKDQNVDQIHQKSSIRRSLSSWLDSGRRVLRR